MTKAAAFNDTRTDFNQLTLKTDKDPKCSIQVRVVEMEISDKYDNASSA